MTTIMKKITKGIVLNGESSDLTDNLEGTLFHNNSTSRIKSYIQGAVREVLTNSQSQVLTNKTIDVDSNTVSNIELDNLKSGVLNTSSTLTSASDSQIPSALAVKTYTDTSSGTVQTNLGSHTGASTAVHGLGVGSSVVGTTDNQTLTTKTINADNNTISNLEVDNLKSGVLNTSITLDSASDTQIPSALAVKTYVDNNSGGAGSTIRSYIQAEQLSVNNPVYLESSTSVGLANASISRKNCIGVVKNLYPNTTTYSFSENFESGSFTTNSWNVVNGTQTNKFYVGTAISNSGTYSAYISNDNGVSNTYSNTASVVWFWKDVAIGSGEYLNFKYKVNGEFSAFPYDIGKIIIDPNRTILPVAGTAINTTPSGGSNTNLPTSNNIWINKQIDLTAYAGTTIRIIFGWENDTATINNPAIAIDNITIGVLGTCDVQVDGILSGFSGLTPGSIYYLSATGSLTTSVPVGTTYYGVPVGIAISSTELDIIPISSSYSDLSNKKIATIKDVKAAGTSGGTAVTGVWTARVLNTLSDPKNIVTSLTSNVFTLPAGVYYINAISPLGASANASSRGRIKLRNTTDSSDTILGMSGRTSFGTSDGNLFVANLNGVFQISASKQFEIQYFVNAGGADSLGATTTDGLDAIYTTVILEKIG